MRRIFLVVGLFISSCAPTAVNQTKPIAVAPISSPVPSYRVLSRTDDFTGTVTRYINIPRKDGAYISINHQISKSGSKLWYISVQVTETSDYAAITDLGSLALKIDDIISILNTTDKNISYDSNTQEYHSVVSLPDGSKVPIGGVSTIYSTAADYIIPQSILQTIKPDSKLVIRFYTKNKNYDVVFSDIGDEFLKRFLQEES